MTVNEKFYVKRFVRNSKSDSYVDEVELNVNPTSAEVRYPGELEATVSIRDLSLCPCSQCPSENRGTPNVSDVSHDLSDCIVLNENEVFINFDFEPRTGSDSSESLISDDNLCDNSSRSAYKNGDDPTVVTRVFLRHVMV